MTHDLGDIVIILLASTLAGLSDRLGSDGFTTASVFVAELTQLCDSYLEEATS